MDDLDVFRKKPNEENLDILRSSLETGADEAEMEGESYGESADNLDEYFPDSEQVNDIREKQTACEEWSELLRNMELTDKPETREDEDFDQIIQDWADEVAGLVDEVASEISI